MQPGFATLSLRSRGLSGDNTGLKGDYGSGKYLRVVSTDCIDAVRTARAKYLGNDPPTSTLLVVSRLARPALLLEIDAIAYEG